MSNNVLPAFPTFETLKESIPLERENYIKSESYGKGDEYIRANEDAEIILDFYQSYLSGTPQNNLRIKK